MLPNLGGKLTAAAARKAAEVQRSTFFKLLRVKDVLQPVDPNRKPSDDEVRAKVGDAADALISRHEPSLPDCERAGAHLQMAALALATQRVLIAESRSEHYHLQSPAIVRETVARTVGVLAPAEGDVTSVPINWVPNKLAMFFSLTDSRRRATIERMVNNFENDLGKAFELSPIDPAPSRRMARCFYADFFEKEGEPELTPVFQVLHGATFSGVKGFTFRREADNTCTFTFE